MNNIRADQQIEYISNTNLATAQRLVNTYINIIKRDIVLEEVVKASGLDITAAQIRKMMSVAQLDETEYTMLQRIHALLRRTCIAVTHRPAALELADMELEISESGI